MKAAANGVLNLSILDGWWDEAYRREVGWAIGAGETYDDYDYQNQIEAEALYDLLERDVVPIFYDRGANSLPRRWIARMKASIGTLCHFYNTHRMVREYTERFYLPAAARYGQLTDDRMDHARALAAWKARAKEHWSQVRVEAIEAGSLRELQVGSDVTVRAWVRLGALTPDDVAVELYLGQVDAHGEIVEAEVVPMELVGPEGEGRFLFQVASVTCPKSGLHGYTVRVLPHHPDLTSPFLPGFIVWADPDVQTR